MKSGYRTLRWLVALCLAGIVLVNSSAQQRPMQAQPLGTPRAQRPGPVQGDRPVLGPLNLPQPLPTLDIQPRLDPVTTPASSEVSIVLHLALPAPEHLAQQVLRLTSSPEMADLARRTQSMAILWWKAALWQRIQAADLTLIALEPRPTALPVMLLQGDPDAVRFLRVLPGVAEVRMGRDVPLPEPIRVSPTPS